MGDGYLNFVFLIVLKRQLFYVDGDRRFEYHCLLIVILIAITQFTPPTTTIAIQGYLYGAWNGTDRTVVSCLAV